MRFRYERHFLDNGLEVIIHPDPNSKIAVFNLLYKVGSKDEIPGKTG
ncbi:MAG: insulinase family protein, partial [Cyclobacteriaceae bacterium]|nr:insulinase family protein [Cyclobacteriaceae bacterium]